ncbi:DNA-binding protein 2 [Bacillus phage vB_BanH_Emiliahah]|nr:DNA-binding protein 2 [Bacillus phage vB_BanH_Emiliahah]
MSVNRKELARRIAHRGNYDIGIAEEFLKLYEDVIVEALENGEEVKQGKLWKILLQELPYKKAWNGLDKQYFDREAKKVPKFKLMSRLEAIELPVKKKRE